jgi:hypothetical protein
MIRDIIFSLDYYHRVIEGSDGSESIYGKVGKKEKYYPQGLLESHTRGTRVNATGNDPTPP